MTGAAPELRVFSDYEAMSRAAAELFADRAQKKAGEGKQFLTAVSGGTTPKRLYELLAAPPLRETVPWASTHVFWADERCVPPDHEDSNFKLVLDALLSRVRMPPENVHRVRGEEGARRAARLYEEELGRSFGRGAVPVFDLVVLGVGGDGHTASLFPGSAALVETKRLAVDVVVPGVRHDRVTLTPPVLNNAACVLVLASGERKKGIVEEVFTRANERGYPAGMVRPANGTLIWFADRAAAPPVWPS